MSFPPRTRLSASIRPHQRARDKQVTSGNEPALAPTHSRNSLFGGDADWESRRHHLAGVAHAQGMRLDRRRRYETNRTALEAFRNLETAHQLLPIQRSQ